MDVTLIKLNYLISLKQHNLKYKAQKASKTEIAVRNERLGSCSRNGSTNFARSKAEMYCIRTISVNAAVILPPIAAEVAKKSTI